MFAEGRVALVTGAGGVIGREICLQFAKNGVHVLLFDISDVALQKTTDALAEQNASYCTFAGDVKNKEDCKKAVALAVETWGQLDILVNLAGIMKNQSIKKLDANTWDQTMDINLKGPMFLMQAAYAPMTQKKYGRIINIASPAYHGAIGQAAYAASKAGLVALTMTAALEFASKGITCNVVCPGMVRSAITKDVPADFMDMIVKKQPTGRLCEGSDVASAVMFFASDNSEYYSGQILEASGGASVNF